MRPVTLARAAASLLAIAVVAGCASGPSEEEQRAEAQAQLAAIQAQVLAARPPISLNSNVIQEAAVYLAYTRDMATLRGGFESPEAIQAALRRGAAYDARQVSRGLIAYAAVLATQSPEFVTGVQSFARDRATRNAMVDRIVANPASASTLPGADAAASLIIATLDEDIRRLREAADSVENDAYAIQADGRTSWARVHVADRESRLANVQSLSRPNLAPAAEASRLSAAVQSGSGLGVASAERLRSPPYPQSVENALALAALALLDGAGENARANTDALMFERQSLDCFESSKLNLFQCLAASRPHYEDMFCLGRHVVRDLGQCARGTALPAGVITVGAPTQSRVAAQERPPVEQIAPRPAPITPAPFTTSPAPAQTPSQTQAPTLTTTQRLNSGIAAPEN
ncbi:hypothetical protein [Brevundimonas bacteroides]|uniref:hypothetical protein n=1 Tax=Brevundimonas bacteroides TaxID=74311 RepID=UPI0006923534|nr:hypothetical protein [Brevundimonas bacteroides]